VVNFTCCPFRNIEEKQIRPVTNEERKIILIPIDFITERFMNISLFQNTKIKTVTSTKG
jgi:hypothetical protein